MCPYFPCLLWIDEGVACFSPYFHAAGEAHNIPVTHRYVFGRLTGSAPFVGSASVEDNLLIF
jgi:hypothetical protein